jgi:acyl carrier protein
MTEMAVKEQIRKFVLETLAWREGIATIADEDSLIDGGVITSLGIYRLVRFFEETFGIQVPDEDLVPHNFCTITDMERYVERRVAAAAGAQQRIAV